MGLKIDKMEEIVLEAMRKIYNSNENYENELDWMGYEINQEDNDAVYHHIISKEDGGNDDISNGAILGRRSRHMLHQLKNIDKDLYDAWNEVFLIINQMGTYPIPEVWNMIMSLQVQTEEVLKSNKNIHQKIR